MMKQHLLLITLLAAAQLLHAQKAQLARGDRAYEEMSFTLAVEEYEQAFRKDASSIPHARRLAECYWNLRDLPNSERWYAVVAGSSQATPEDIYRYAELLRIIGRYGDSDLWMKRYAKLAPHDSRIKRKENATERLGELLSVDGVTHKLIRVSSGLDHSDISPFIHADSVIFASTRVDRYTTRDVHSWNGQPFLNLFSGKLGPEGQITNIKPLAGMNTRYHESNAVISRNGDQLYFTRNNYMEGRKVLSESGVNNLQIYVRHMTPKGWSKEVPFVHNSASYSVGHPALTRDGERIYFTSDMPGGMGGKDIYVCYREANGGWSEPQNLGPVINTEGDEMFPYVHENNLYFSSDGHLGMGGLDIFRCAIRENGYGVLENLGAPINSTNDDFGLCLDEAGETGFITSDRDGALGQENLYWFRMNSKADEDRIWVGRVLDISDARPVPHLTVRLLDLDRNELARTLTGLNGVFQFNAPRVAAMVSAAIPGGTRAELLPAEYEVSLYSDTELPDLYLNSVMDLPVNAIVRDARTNEWLEGVTVTVKDPRDGAIVFYGVTNGQGITQGEIPEQRFGEDVNFEVVFNRTGYLQKTVYADFRVLMFLEQGLTGPDGTSMSPISAGIDMAQAMNLRPIYFDFREDRIRSDAAGELDLVAQVMKLDPSITIDLRSHTDSRASMEHNDLLSQRRAESTRNYLVAQGIHPSRITYKGYGERRLVNHCSDDVECSEEEHQANRRTEFIITSCKDCGPLPSATAR